MKKICLLTAKLEENTVNDIKLALNEKFDLVIGGCADISDADCERVSAIIGNPSGKELERFTNLEWLQLTSSGADFYAKSGVLDKDKTVLTNATGAYGHGIAEYLVACVFAMTKNLHLYRDNQAQSNWCDMGPIKTINGSNVLVVGLGDIGSKFAIKMNALGANVYGIKRVINEKPEYIKELYTLDKLNELLPMMDSVALCLPNSARTIDLIGDEQFKLMKKDALLLNVGRGTAVNTDALLAALQSKEIGGAVLDVTNPEPLPADHPLWKEKNVLITPHISGGNHSQETVDTIQKIVITNTKHYANGEKLEYLVDFETGYRKL